MPAKAPVYVKALILREPPCISGAELGTAALAFNDPCHEVFAVIYEHIIALPAFGSGAGHDFTA